MRIKPKTPSFGSVSFLAWFVTMFGVFGVPGIIVALGLVAYGYINNIACLFSLLMGANGQVVANHAGELIIRVVGVFYGPIGVIAGYF